MENITKKNLIREDLMNSKKISYDNCQASKDKWNVRIIIQRCFTRGNKFRNGRNVSYHKRRPKLSSREKANDLNSWGRISGVTVIARQNGRERQKPQRRQKMWVTSINSTCKMFILFIVNRPYFVLHIIPCNVFKFVSSRNLTQCHTTRDAFMNYLRRELGMPVL